MCSGLGCGDGVGWSGGCDGSALAATIEIPLVGLRVTNFLVGAATLIDSGAGGALTTPPPPPPAAAAPGVGLVAVPVLNADLPVRFCKNLNFGLAAGGGAAAAVTEGTAVAAGGGVAPPPVTGCERAEAAFDDCSA